MAGLKSQDVFSKMTKEQRKEEYLKCKASSAYFVHKYCMVKHPDRGLIPFLLYDFQSELLSEFKKNRYNLYVKSRQIGISTLVACYSLWLSIFFKHQSILILATKRDVAKNMLQKVKLAYNHIPRFFKELASIEENNSTIFKLSTGSEVKCVGTTRDAVRSEALSLMIIDEAAFIEEMDEIWTAAQPALSAGGKCVVLSSPNGEGDWFHEQFALSQEGEGIFRCKELMWWLHPERDAQWEKDTRQALVTDEKFAQEYECSFLASGSTVIEASILKKITEMVLSPIMSVGFENCLWIWEEHDIKKNYIISVDVCKGDKTDFSVAEVWRIGDKLEQVAELRTKQPTDEFGEELYKLCVMYGKPLTIVESNSYGTAVLNVLKLKKYKNIFFAKKKWENFEKYDLNKDYSRDKEYEMGIYTAQKSKELIIDKLQESIRNLRVVVRSSRLMRELKTFIWTKEHKARASGKNNDDTVMAASFACWVYETVLGRGEAKEGEYFDSFKYAKLNSNNILDVNRHFTGYQRGSCRKYAIDPFSMELISRPKKYTN